MRLAVLLLLLTALLVATNQAAAATKRAVPATGYRDWKVAAGGPDSLRYSALSQINRDNVARLQIAWTYDTGDASKDSEMEGNPIVAHGVLYATSPRLRVIALDAATGRLLWSFHPPEATGNRFRNRGVTYWEDGDDRRIFFGARQ